MRQAALSTAATSREIKLQQSIDEAIASTIGIYSDELENNRVVNYKASAAIQQKKAIEEAENLLLQEGTGHRGCRLQGHGGGGQGLLHLPSLLIAGGVFVPELIFYLICD